MTDDAERWKEKYLKSLEQQEKLERRWDARLDLLRRGLVRSSLAAEGSDKAVDECMKEMREVIRGDSMDAGLAALIPRLERAVLDSEHRRETRMNQVREALTSLVQQLQSLPLPSEQGRALKKLAKKLDGGVSQSRELPPLLGELSGLQGRALAALQNPAHDARPGLFQRLFGTREAEPSAVADDSATFTGQAGGEPVVAEAAAQPAAAPSAEASAPAPGDAPAPAAAPAASAGSMMPPAPAASKGPAPAADSTANAAPDATAVLARPAAPDVRTPPEAPAAVDAPSVPSALPAQAAPVPPAEGDTPTPLAVSAAPDAPATVEPPEPSPAASHPAPATSPALATPALDASPGHEAADERGAHADPVQRPSSSPTALQTPVTQPIDNAFADPAPPQLHAESAPGSEPTHAAQLGAEQPPPLPPLTDTYASEDGPYALPHAVEPPYSQVAAHIEHTLLGLLDDLTLPERYKDQALGMRERVARGLNWYELIPILDDLAVLMLAINDSGQHAFEAYLQALNERLEAFHSHLRDASAGHADNQVAARQLDSQLREHVDGLQHSVQGAHDLDSLKQVLDSRLEGLIGTLDEHQQARDRREQALADRLQGLAARVAGMEQEALGFREHLEEQRQKALIDPLTGLPNRAAWAERVAQELHAWQAQGGHLSMAIFDLDHFKRINDGYGHLAGDKVLKLVANVLRKRLRGRDFMARFGGEEFVLLMPQTAPAAAAQHVESLRAAVQACPFHFKGEPVTITTSIGLSAFRSGEASEVVLDRADKALYRAKGQGRNRIEQG